VLRQTAWFASRSSTEQNLVREARQLLNLSRVATAALGRQLMMTVIMSADLKGEHDLVSTILKGDGPLAA
jgi:redox-regulated HSP33 family molecular chaperone